MCARPRWGRGAASRTGAASMGPHAACKQCQALGVSYQHVMYASYISHFVHMKCNIRSPASSAKHFVYPINM